MKAGWKNQTIGDVCTVVNGGTPKTGVAAYWDGPHQWVTPAEMGKRQSPYIARTERTVADAGLADSSARLVPALSVILSSRAPIGHLVINTVPMAFNQGCKGLIPRAGLDCKFLFYFLLSSVPLLDSLGTGATFRELSAGKLKEVAIAVPALDEQKRIVAILDEAFEGIARATAITKANADSAEELLDGVRHSLLLEEKASAEFLPLSALIENGWIVSHLDGNHGAEYPRKEEFIASGVPYISANSIDDEEVDMSAAKFLAPARADRIRKGVAVDGDVLFAHNATVGPVAILHTDEPRVILGTSLTYYRCNTAFLDAPYLAHYMRSRLFREQYEQIMRQSTRNQVPITKQREFFHLVPSLEKQAEISRKLDGLEEQCRVLKRAYKEKLALLAELKQSLLHKAFTGQLTSADNIAA